MALLALTSRNVKAEPHRLCLHFNLGPGYWDASPRAADGRSFHEEYGRNEGPEGFPAQRWLARVHDQTADEVVFGWQPLDGNGCADFELGGDTDLMVEWVRWAVWDEDVETGNHLVGYECDVAMGACDVATPTFRVLPADMVTGVTDVVIPTVDVPAIDYVFWAASFAEERLASMGQQPLTNARVYLSYDAADILPGATQADRTFGNQPSVVVDAQSWHSKFTIAHELGHQQTLAASSPTFDCDELDYCYDPEAYPVTPTAPDEAQEYAIPRETAWCTTIGEDPCPAGVGNEWDWASALRLFHQSDSAPSLRTTLTMLTAAYATGTWVANGASDAFWQGFDEAMVGHLGAEYPGWVEASQQMELGR